VPGLPHVTRRFTVRNPDQEPQERGRRQYSTLTERGQHVQPAPRCGVMGHMVELGNAHTPLPLYLQDGQA
jgi:hypothetical protein